MQVPERSYVICTTPRTGSNLLCDLLASSKVMGEPKEFFNVRSTIVPIASKHDLIRPDSTLDMAAYLDHIMRTQVSSNGVFGTKLLFSQLLLAMKFERARALLMEARYIWLTRRDIVAQGVSAYLARQLGAWSLHGERRRDDRGIARRAIPYDEEKIRERVSDVDRHNAGWSEFFCVNGFEVMSITYEDLIADPSGVCRAVCKHCGVATNSEFRIEDAGVQRQSDDVNRDFGQRFTRDSRLNLNSQPPSRTKTGRFLEREGVRLQETDRSAVAPSQG